MTGVTSPDRERSFHVGIASAAPDRPGRRCERRRPGRDRADRGQTQTRAIGQKSKADPKINEPFKKPDVKEYVKRFETE